MPNTIPNQADGSQGEAISDAQWMRQIMTMMSEQQRTLSIAIAHMAGTQFKKTKYFDKECKPNVLSRKRKR